jgi:hypothetical protein
MNTLLLYKDSLLLSFLSLSAKLTLLMLLGQLAISPANHLATKLKPVGLNDNTFIKN